MALVLVNIFALVSLIFFITDTIFQAFYRRIKRSYILEPLDSILPQADGLF